MRKFYFIFLTILIISTNLSAQSGIEFNITISGKILIGINHRISISEHHYVRYGVNMGYTGPPVGLNLGLFQEFNSDQTWRPYAGISVDALLPKMNGKRTIVPFLKAAGGVAYSPQENLAHQSEMWLAYFWKTNTFQPIGMSLTHFNSVLE